MAEPSQKSLEAPYIWRLPTVWQMPQWQQATIWRWFVYNQPIAMLCRGKLVNYLLGLPWEITARDPAEKEALTEDCNYYTKFLLRSFDLIFDRLWQDALDLPIGGALEIVRWPVGVQPVIKEGDEEYKVTRNHPYGHPYKLVNLDGATIFPTYDPDIPLAQKIPELESVVYFTENEVGRVGVQPRTEMRLKGYFKAPPEQVYLAIKMVNSSDHYYNDLLEEVPPVGILDLVDMSQESATQWAGSVRALFEGNDPFKIPTLYEHTKPAVFIPFGKSPQELLFDTASLRYARVVAASYGLTLGNLGLEPKGESLAGSIRDDMQASQGYGVVVEKTKGLLDNEVLPPYLEWNAKVQDFEKLTGKGRAFLVTTQALKAAKEAGFIDAGEGQAQLVRDGFLTVEVEPPEEAEEVPPGLPSGFGTNGGGAGRQLKQITDKVPPAEGGLGEAKKEKAETEAKADYSYASTQFDMPDNIIRLVKDLQARIDPADLTQEDGLETNPHVTIKYGLTSDDPAAVERVARLFQPFYLNLGEVSLFEKEDFDVVKIEVEGETLRQLNQAIAATGAVDTHPGYNPHLTLAYVAPGTGKKYLSLSVPHQSVLVSTITFSTSDGYLTKIPLGEAGAGYVNGGHANGGQVVTRAETVTAQAARLEEALKMRDALALEFGKLTKKATPARLGKFVRAAVKLIFPLTQKRELPDEWQAELEKLVLAESWARLSKSITGALESATGAAFSSGASLAADEVRQALFEAGLLDSAPVAIDFNLTNPRTLAELTKKAALLVRRIDEGTRFYLKRAIVSGVEEGLSSPRIAALIKEGAGVEEVLSQAGFVEEVTKSVRADLERLTPERAASIVSTEVNRAESEGRLAQWSKMGLTRKAWQTAGEACDICRRNEAEGFVEMAHVYEDVFDGTLTPPAHPNLCRCHLEFDEEELMEKAGELEVWGGD